MMSDAAETQERKRCRTDSSFAQSDDDGRGGHAASSSSSEAGKPNAGSPSAADATDAAILLENVAGRVSVVNREMIQLLQAQVRTASEHVHRKVEESTAAVVTAVHLSKDLVHKHGQLIAAEAAADELRNALTAKTQLLDAGMAQLEERVCHAAAAGSLVRAACAVTTAEASTLAVMNANLSETCAAQERDRTSAVERWQQQLLRAQHESRTAQLQCQLLLSDRQRLVDALGAKHEEAMRLMDLVERMSERNKNESADVESATQSRTLVRLLEQQLSLEGIVQAVIPRDSELHARARSAAARGPPPDPRMKEVAPDFFALRLLEYRDVSIAELVNEWQRQDEELRREKAAHGMTLQQLERLQRDASKTHCLYMEERRRREAESRRLGELQRQRISGTPGTLNDFDQLRLEHSTALDNLAMLSVNIQQLRDEATRLQQREQFLEATVADLRAEAQLSGVAQAVANAKLNYERQVQLLSQKCHAAETERDIQKIELDQHRQQAVALHRECDELRRAVAASTAAMSSLQHLKDSQERLLRDTVANLREVASSAAPSSTPPPPLLRAAATLSQEHSEVSRLIADLVGALGQVQNAVAAQPHRESVDCGQANDVGGATASESAGSTTELRRVLREALRFTAEQLAATERLRTHFAEQQLADSACVHAFYERLEQARSERDRVLLELESAQRLIERHSLHAAEAILMHEVDRTATTMTGASLSGSPGSPQHRNHHQQQHGASSVEAELSLLRHELHEKQLQLAKTEATLLQREQELQAQVVEVSRSRAAAKSSAREAAWWKATMEAERQSQRRLAEQLDLLRNQFVARADAFALECNDATALHRQVSRTVRLEGAARVEAVDEHGGAHDNLGDAALPAVSSPPRSLSTEPVGELTDVESIVLDDVEEVEDAFDEEDGDGTNECYEDEECPVPVTTVTEEDNGEGNVAAGNATVAGEDEGSAPGEVQQQEEVVAVPCATLEEWTEQTKSEMDSLSPLLLGIASTLSDVKAAVTAIARPKEDTTALVSRTINAEADATRTLDDAVEEKLRTDGIHAVVGIVREIYETCNLVQQRRVALHGEDESQAVETTSLALETLRRKCAGLEEVAARSTQALAQEREDFSKQLQAKSAQLQQLQVDADKALRASQEHASLNQRLQHQLTERQLETQRLSQELERKDAMNRKLMELVNALKAKVLAANGANAVATAATVAPAVPLSPAPTGSSVAAPSPPLPSQIAAASLPPPLTQALPPTIQPNQPPSPVPETQNPEASLSSAPVEAESTV